MVRRRLAGSRSFQLATKLRIISSIDAISAPSGWSISRDEGSPVRSIASITCQVGNLVGDAVTASGNRVGLRLPGRSRRPTAVSLLALAVNAWPGASTMTEPRTRGPSRCGAYRSTPDPLAVLSASGRDDLSSADPV